MTALASSSRPLAFHTPGLLPQVDVFDGTLNAKVVAIHEAKPDQRGNGARDGEESSRSCVSTGTLIMMQWTKAKPRAHRPVLNSFVDATVF